MTLWQIAQGSRIFTYPVLDSDPDRTLAAIVETAIQQTKRIRQGGTPFGTYLEATTMYPDNDRTPGVAALRPRLLGHNDVKKETVFAFRLAGRGLYGGTALPRCVRLRADFPIGTILNTSGPVVDGVCGRLEAKRVDGRRRVPDIGEVVVGP